MLTSRSRRSPSRSFSRSRSYRTCRFSQNLSDIPKYRDNRRAISAVIARGPRTISLIRRGGTLVSLATRYWLMPSGIRNSSVVRVFGRDALTTEPRVDQGRNRDQPSAATRRSQNDCSAASVTWRTSRPYSLLNTDRPQRGSASPPTELGVKTGASLSGRREIRRVRPPHCRQSPSLLVLHSYDCEKDIAQLLLVSGRVGPSQPGRDIDDRHLGPDQVNA
jgi:hypothetical protein